MRLIVCEDQIVIVYDSFWAIYSNKCVALFITEVVNDVRRNYELGKLLKFVEIARQKPS